MSEQYLFTQEELERLAKIAQERSIEVPYGLSREERREWLKKSLKPKKRPDILKSVKSD